APSALLAAAAGLVSAFAVVRQSILVSLAWRARSATNGMFSRDAIVTPSNRPALLDLQQIDVVCDRFERAWLSGRRPELAEFVVLAPASVRAILFRDLLNLELEYCRQRGEQPNRRSYAERFPDYE